MYTIKINSVDKTDLVRKGTIKINKGADNRNDCSMDLLTTADYVDFAGLDLKVYDGTTLVFGGIIKTGNRQRYEPGIGTDIMLLVPITSNGYGDIPSRRTTSSTYTAQYAGAIVTDIINNVINLTGYDDEITAGTIANGAYLETYSAICKSCKDVFDELADASGFKWYINDQKELNFVSEDAVLDAAHDIAEGEAFTDYRDVEVEECLADYCNKVFVRGATVDGTPIQVIVSDEDEINTRVAAEGGSGVYGKVIEDPNIQSEAYATVVGNNALKKYGAIPITVSFSSFSTDWQAGTKLRVNLPTMGISSDISCLIESVLIYDLPDGTLVSEIIATRRKEGQTVLQGWPEEYPDSPVTTAEYPYQWCYTNESGFMWLYVNTGKYYHDLPERFRVLSVLDSDIYKVVDGEWVYQFSSNIESDWFFEDPEYYHTYTNCDIYTDVTFTDVYFPASVTTTEMSTQRLGGAVEFFSKLTNSIRLSTKDNAGGSGTFTTADSKTVTVTNGLITEII